MFSESSLRSNQSPSVRYLNRPQKLKENSHFFHYSKRAKKKKKKIVVHGIENAGAEHTQYNPIRSEIFV